MEDKKKDAYLHLMYRAFVDVRLYSAMYHQIKSSWWNPFRLIKFYKYIRQINRLADAFHNLPSYLKSDNTDFNEEYFWHCLETYEKQFMTNGEDTYKSLFIRAIEGQNRNRKDTICPVCEEYTFEFPNDFDICPICGWENNGVQSDQKDYWGGANSLSVNEAKVVYSLSLNESNKSKIHEIIDKYNQRQREIHTQYADIDHRTAEGEKYRKALVQAHNNFVTELYELSEEH